MKEIVFTSNSPGEVSSWVRVTVAALRPLLGKARVSVALVPCPYASGAELRVVQELPGVDQAFSPWQTTQFYFGLRDWGWRPAPQGVVVFLGGEPWHALLLARRLGYTSMGYFPAATFWSRFFDYPVMASEVGDLMVDGVAGAPTSERSGPCLAFFPGSRPWHVGATMGVYMAMAERLRERYPELRFCLVQSPFVTDASLRKALAKPWALGLPTSTAEVLPDRLVTAAGVEIRKLSGVPNTIFPEFDVAVTIPGTNTAELACAGKPFVTVLHAKAQVGAGGLWGLLERTPFLPQRWKMQMRERRLRRYNLVALPNRLAGRAVVPEVLITDSTRGVEDHLLAFLQDSELARETGSSLMKVMGERGASLRFAQQIASHV